MVKKALFLGVATTLALTLLLAAVCMLTGYSPVARGQDELEPRAYFPIVMSGYDPSAPTSTPGPTATSTPTPTPTNTPTPVPQDPATIILVAAPGTLPADGESESEITAVVLNVVSLPVPDGTLVVFTADMGSFVGLSVYMTQTVGGIAQAYLTAPLTVGTGTVNVTAGTISDFVEVVFESLPTPTPTPTPDPSPASISLTKSKDGICNDNTDYSRIEATVRRADGELVANGTPVYFHTNRGNFDGSSGVWRSTISGQARADLRSYYCDNMSTPATVTVTSGSVSKSITVNISVNCRPGDACD